MIRSSLSCLILSLSTGCVAWPHAPGMPQAAASGIPGAAVGQYHFDWQLSGHRAVAPLQVFDDGRRTWLQFPPGQPAPAIFSRSTQGDTLLSPLGVRGGFLVLDGVWPHLVVRGGHLQSDLRRQAGQVAADAVQAMPVTAAPASSATALPVPLLSGSSVPVPGLTADAGKPPLPIPALAVVPDAAALPASTRPGVAAGERPGTEPFKVGPQDGTVRSALSRWASAAGWTFAAEHWAVAVDIPITGSATFRLPFLQAVQELVASTELSDHPLQPCFYANQVLRVVPYAQSCDRTAGGTAS